MKPVLHLLGAGRAGSALLRLLHREGHEIGRVVARGLESAEASVAAIGAGTAGTEPAQAFGDESITLLGLPERALAPAAAELSRKLPPLRGAIALHLSGSVAAEVLAPLRGRGVEIGSIHPLASFADRASPPDSLEGTTFDVDGDARARAVARDLARELRGHVVELGADGKALFHAAASVASNAFVALFDLACRLAERAGASPLAARGAMTALVSSTLDNLARSGSPAALTGPIERGEIGVIERHLDAIARRAPQELELYLECARATLAVALRKGTLKPEQ